MQGRFGAFFRVPVERIQLAKVRASVSPCYYCTVILFCAGSKYSASFMCKVCTEYVACVLLCCPCENVHHECADRDSPHKREWGAENWRHPRVISDCHFAVQLNHFIPGLLSYLVPVF